MSLKLRCDRLFFFLAMAAMPALAQFEISPDHFGSDQPNSEKAADSGPAAHLKQQIAEQISLLAGYRSQIETQAALVEQSRQLLISPAGSADEAGESIALSVNEKRLEELKRSLADRIRVAETILAGLETKQAVLMASAKDRPPVVARRQARVLKTPARSASLYSGIHNGLPPQTPDSRTRETEISKVPAR
jgi:hypothetical protein